MVLNSIEKLLEKYDNGETTLKEEQQKQNSIPMHLIDRGDEDIDIASAEKQEPQQIRTERFEDGLP